MPSQDVICPECLTPADLWFEFGGSIDRHCYYHCETCGRSCAVRQQAGGQQEQHSPWVREAAIERRLPQHPGHQG
jgi:hypothetical protein